MSTAKLLRYRKLGSRVVKALKERFFVTTRLCKPAGRIKVILVGQDLGL
jgi:hypothetical protein